MYVRRNAMDFWENSSYVFRDYGRYSCYINDCICFLSK